MKPRGKMLEEYVDVMLKAWTGEPFEWQGRTITVTPKPLDAAAPDGAHRRGQCGRGRAPAARLRLPMLPMNTDQVVQRCVRRRSREKVGFDGGFVMTPSGPTFVHVADDPEQAWAEIGAVRAVRGADLRELPDARASTRRRGCERETIDDLKQRPVSWSGRPTSGRAAAEEVPPTGGDHVQPARGRSAARPRVGEPRAVRVRGPAASVVAVARSVAGDEGIADRRGGAAGVERDDAVWPLVRSGNGGYRRSRSPGGSAMARYRRFDTARAATMTMPDAIERDAIQSVRLRREGLRSAMGALERAAGRARTGSGRRLAGWCA